MTDEGANQSGLTHAVSPHQTDCLAGVHGEVDAMQDMTGAIVSVQFAGFDDRRAAHEISSALPRYALCTSWLARISAGAPVARTLPFTMTVRTSANRNTASMSCSTNKIASLSTSLPIQSTIF